MSLKCRAGCRAALVLSWLVEGGWWLPSHLVWWWEQWGGRLTALACFPALWGLAGGSPRLKAVVILGCFLVHVVV